MLAELTTLLHETTDSLRGIWSRRRTEAVAGGDGAPTVIWLTGLPSRGKQRLHSTLASSNLTVLSASRPPARTDVSPERRWLHVHAETDLDGWLEPAAAAQARALARLADVVVPADWEAPHHSLRRVIEALSARTPSARAGV